MRKELGEFFNTIFNVFREISGDKLQDRVKGKRGKKWGERGKSEGIAIENREN